MEKGTMRPTNAGALIGRWPLNWKGNGPPAPAQSLQLECPGYGSRRERIRSQTLSPVAQVCRQERQVWLCRVQKAAVITHTSVSGVPARNTTNSDANPVKFSL